MNLDVFKYSRYESFEYEVLTFGTSGLEHKSYITDYVKSGKINIDFSKDIIGSANFVIKESDNNIPDIDYLTDLIKVWYNISGSGNSYRIPLGVFKLSSPTKDSNGVDVHRNVNALDLLYTLDQDKTTVASNFTAGTNVIDAVKSILDSVGTWVQYNIDDNTSTLSEDMTYQLGRSKLYIINGLLKAINYYPIWCSGNGVFKAIPWSELKSTTWDFYDNNESLYQKGIKYTLDYSDTYNKIIIVTNETNEDTDPITSELTFEDLGIENYISFSYTNLGFYKTKIFNSEAVSQDYADARAMRELLKMLENEESINYKHAFITSRENDGLPYQGDCYNFENQLLNLNAVYKIEQMDFDLSTGSMVNSNIRRIISVT